MLIIHEYAQALKDGQSKVKLFYIQVQNVDDAAKEHPRWGFTRLSLSPWLLFS